MDPLNSTKKQEDFSPTEVSMEENTSAENSDSRPQNTTTPEKNRKYSPLDWGLTGLIVLGIIFIVIVAIQKSTTTSTTDPNTTEPEVSLSQSEIITLRKQMSDDARTLGENSAPGSDFIANMTAHIDSAPAGNARNSLQIYLIYLSSRHGFYEDAIVQYDSYMDNKESLSPAEICELSEYRLMASKYFTNSYDDLEPVKTDRETSCAEALSQEEYIQAEDESDLDYGNRLFYNGFLTDSYSLLEKIDVSTLTTEEEKAKKYDPLLELALANAEFEKHDRLIWEIKNQKGTE